MDTNGRDVRHHPKRNRQRKLRAKVRRVVAIDPGSKESAVVALDGSESVLTHFIDANERVLTYLNTAPLFWTEEFLVIERVQHYGSGMPVGRDVFDTVEWGGRFIERWTGKIAKIARPTIKAHLCGSARAKDANVRQALIDRYGGKKAIGKKASPGPLYGIKSHEWSALAVAVTFLDTIEEYSNGQEDGTTV